jgi:hypothetical protein
MLDTMSSVSSIVHSERLPVTLSSHVFSSANTISTNTSSGTPSLDTIVNVAIARVEPPSSRSQTASVEDTQDPWLLYAQFVYEHVPPLLGFDTCFQFEDAVQGEGNQKHESCATCHYVAFEPVIENLKLVCKAHVSSPLELVYRFDLFYWERWCEGRVIKCSLCKQMCNIGAQCQGLIKHVKEDCRYQCALGCGQTVPYSEWNAHQLDCANSDVPCPFHTFLVEHQAALSARNIVMPVRCSWKGSRLELARHLDTNKCSQLLALAQSFWSLIPAQSTPAKRGRKRKSLPTPVEVTEHETHSTTQQYPFLLYKVVGEMRHVLRCVFLEDARYVRMSDIRALYGWGSRTVKALLDTLPAGTYIDISLPAVVAHRPLSYNPGAAVNAEGLRRLLTHEGERFAAHLVYKQLLESEVHLLLEDHHTLTRPGWIQLPLNPMMIRVNSGSKTSRNSLSSSRRRISEPSPFSSSPGKHLYFPDLAKIFTVHLRAAASDPVRRSEPIGKAKEELVEYFRQLCNDKEKEELARCEEEDQARVLRTVSRAISNQSVYTIPDGVLIRRGGSV